MKSKFKIGQRVWVYDCPLWPQVATIKSKFNDNLDLWLIETDGKSEYLDMKYHSGSNLYPYPDGINDVLSVVDSDILNLKEGKNKATEQFLIKNEVSHE